MNPHMHKYKFESELTGDHKHRLTGFTEGMVGINSFHLHYFNGISSYNNHTHYYTGMTGFPIKTKNGHMHRIEGILETNNMHEHKFNSFTQEDVAYYSDGIIHEAYV